MSFIYTMKGRPRLLYKLANCYEAILVKDGFVTEGTSSNVYIIKNNVIYTAPLSKQILPGITRIAVKEIANTLSITFTEKQFTPNELLVVDEVFITSTTNEIMPIVSVDGKKINDGSSGELSMKLFNEFKTVVKKA